MLQVHLKSCNTLFCTYLSACFVTTGFITMLRILKLIFGQILFHINDLCWCLCPPVAGPWILTIACFDRSSPLQTVRVLLDSRPPPIKVLSLASPRLASETRLKPSDNNLPQFPPSHLHSRLPAAPAEPLGLSQRSAVLVKKARRDPRRRGPCVFTTAGLSARSSLSAPPCPPLNAQDKKDL